MGLKEVQEEFARKGITNEILTMDESTATVELAAAALGTEPGEIAKSMAFKLKDDSVIIVVFMGTARIDNRKFKDRFHCKATMLTAEETPALTGHPVGGVCPFGLPENVTVYLDESLKKYEAVYPAAGNRHNAVRFTIPELEAATGAEWVDVGKIPEEA
ncbi:MAG: YbaK/EbsC family protein [Firmicutes bacterium]|nr:YbaK/EbsC family protein [Bacillota bacterium]